MNPQAQMLNGNLLPQEKLIKPMQVYNLEFLSPEQKAKYHEGVTTLWRKMELPDQHPEKHNAYQTLSDLSTRLKSQMVRWRQENGLLPQGTQMRPTLSAQQQDQAMAMQQANARQMAARQGNVEFSARVKLEAGNFQPAIPQGIQQRSVEDQKQWINNQKRSYAMLLQRYEQAKLQTEKFQQTVQARRQERGLNQTEQQQAQTRMIQLQNALREAQSSIMQFKQKHEQANAAQVQAQQQAQLQLQEQQQQAQAASQAVKANEQNQQKQEPLDSADSTVQIKTETENNDVQDSGTRPSTANQDQKPPAPQQSSGTHPPLAAPPAQQGRPSVSAPVPQSSSQGAQAGASASGPYPLSHQAAISRAASMNQSTTPGHGHPATQPPGQNIQREQPASNNTLNRHPPTRPLNIPPLTAVNMAAARPTLPGGPGPVGPIGQPAIQTFPGYMLRGEGDRVLSKNKLQELVREVTGGAGGEGAETLDPEVEEVCDISIGSL